MWDIAVILVSSLAFLIYVAWPLLEENRKEGPAEPASVPEQKSGRS